MFTNNKNSLEKFRYYHFHILICFAKFNEKDREPFKKFQYLRTDQEIFSKCIY